ncbi:hypothetical protein ACQ1R0_03710 [Ornithobacterium rhinotracheale]
MRKVDFTKDGILNPIKFFGRVFNGAFWLLIVFFLLMTWIDPAPFGYKEGVWFFAVLYFLSYPFQYLFELMRLNRFILVTSVFYPIWIEVLFFLLFALLMPLTGDLGA